MISVQSENQGSAAPTGDLDEWFQSQVLPVEDELRGWLKHRYPHAAEHDDIIQEAYVKVLRTRRRRSVGNVRALLFTTARHLAIDRIRREIRSPIQDISRERACTVPAGDPDSGEAASRSHELRLLVEALEGVPPRARAALELRIFQGLSGPQAGARMGISQHTVNAHVAAGIRYCARYFRERGALELRVARAKGLSAAVSGYRQLLAR